MSIEGMWKFQSGNVDGPSKLAWGGIVILETGRVLGGDSSMAYLGTYNLEGKSIKAKVRSWTWNTDVPAGQNVFGVSTEILSEDQNFEVILDGQFNDNVIEGVLYPVDVPDFKLRARMEKIAELPG